MMEEDIFRCFNSRAIVAGRKMVVNVEKSAHLKRVAVYRGFTDEKGRPKKNLHWLEHLVILMREATSAEPFNHEWWAAEVSKPEWVRNLDRYYQESWLHFPDTPADLTAREVGRKIGYQLALNERRAGKAQKDKAFLKKLDASEKEKAKRGLDAATAKKVRVVIPGFESWKEALTSSGDAAKVIRSGVLSLCGSLPLEESTELTEGYQLGSKKAASVDLDNELSEFNEREEIIEILDEYYDVIDSMRTRTEIAHFIRNHLPEHKRRELEKKGDLWKSFTERLRDIFKKIGLSPAPRGRPRKNRGKRKQ